MSKNQEDILNYLRGTPAETPDNKELRQEDAPAVQPEVINEATTIFIGCRPMYGETVSLVDYVAPMMTEIAKAEGVDHIAFIPYAKGWDLLAARLIKDGLPHGAYYIPAMSPMAQRLSDTLIHIADQVVIAG